MFCFKIFVGVLKEKLKLHFSRIVLVLGRFWILCICILLITISWCLANLLGTLIPNLGTKFSKYLLIVSAVSKSSVSRLPFSIRDIFSKLFDLSEKKLFTVSQNVLLSTVFYVEIPIVCFFGFLE